MFVLFLGISQKLNCKIIKIWTISYIFVPIFFQNDRQITDNKTGFL